jgi:hypothetical protein
VQVQNRYINFYYAKSIKALILSSYKLVPPKGPYFLPRKCHLPLSLYTLHPIKGFWNLCWCYFNRILETVLFVKNKKLFITVLEVRTFKIKVPEDWCLERVCSPLPKFCLECFIFFFLIFFIITYFPQLHLECYPKSPPYPPPHFPTHTFPFFGPGIPLYWGI